MLWGRNPHFEKGDRGDGGTRRTSDLRIRGIKQPQVLILHQILFGLPELPNNKKLDWTSPEKVVESFLLSSLA